MTKLRNETGINEEKIICLLTATTLLVSNVCSVSAANVCGESTVFQNNKTRALATTYWADTPLYT